jgi:hypothetical protein
MTQEARPDIPDTAGTPSGPKEAGNAESGAPYGTPSGIKGEVFTQEQLNKLVAERVAKERERFADYDDLKAKASELDKLKDAQKSELEKATEKLAAAEAKAKALEEEAKAREWRLAARTERGLPESVDPLLTGATKEEIEAKADILAAQIPKGAKPVVRMDTGAASEPAEGSGLKEFFKERLGG